MEQAELDRFLDWIEAYRDTFTVEAMDCGNGSFLMRKLGPHNKLLLSIKIEKVRGMDE